LQAVCGAKHKACGAYKKKPNVRSYGTDNFMRVYLPKGKKKYPMSEFIVSARKYRPATFDTVVGQVSITTTLKNSIKNSHLAQAYLFCGPRGVGKTTCARIYAKTINCQDLTPEIEACDKCASCKGFNASSSYNIHELDAASNNSVEDIRSLIDQVRIPPQMGRYSIYIIDEVHMLSAAAFNAFLKTLEEPPKHAIFILATTEKHKILPTILSRCQIFDFNRIKAEDAAEHLASVASKEGINAEIEALNIIALKADGAMRDALSIFDQVVSFCGQNITYKGVIENLNVLDYDYFFKIVDFLLVSDYKSSLLLFDEILDRGFDGHNFINGLNGHIRDLLVSQDASTIQLLEVGAAIREKYKDQAKKCQPDFLMDLLEIGNKFDLGYKASKNKRLHVELELLQMSTAQKKKLERQQALTAKPEAANTPAVQHQAAAQQPAPHHRPASLARSPSFNEILGGGTQQAKPAAAQPAHKIAAENTKYQAAQAPSAIDATGTDAPNIGISQAWDAFVDSLRNSHPRLYGALMANRAQTNDGNVNINLASEEAAAQMASLKTEAETFIKDRTGSAAILNIAVNKPAAVKAGSPSEKFSALNRINPNLESLREAFDLDI
jgi:DNA polymerase III subunit gamma/tau